MMNCIPYVEWKRDAEAFRILQKKAPARIMAACAEIQAGAANDVDIWALIIARHLFGG